jgi:hypothetical protein
MAQIAAVDTHPLTQRDRDEAEGTSRLLGSKIQSMQAIEQGDAASLQGSAEMTSTSALPSRPPALPSRLLNPTEAAPPMFPDTKLSDSMGRCHRTPAWIACAVLSIATLTTFVSLWATGRLSPFGSSPSSGTSISSAEPLYNLNLPDFPSKGHPLQKQPSIPGQQEKTCVLPLMGMMADIAFWIFTHGANCLQVTR